MAVLFFFTTFDIIISDTYTLTKQLINLNYGDK